MADQSPKTPTAQTREKTAAKPAETTPEGPAAESTTATGATGATEDTKATEAAGTAEPHVPVTEDAKSKFAAALERKKQTGQARAAHLDGHSGVGGATSSHKATRTFRRKSGSA